jgi:hypothetical protein
VHEKRGVCLTSRENPDAHCCMRIANAKILQDTRIPQPNNVQRIFFSMYNHVSMLASFTEGALLFFCKKRSAGQAHHANACRGPRRRRLHRTPYRLRLGLFRGGDVWSIKHPSIQLQRPCGAQGSGHLLCGLPHSFKRNTEAITK